MKIYLASPFFNSVERKRVQKIAELYRNMGHEVYVPMEHEVENAWDLPNHIWGSKVFADDVNAIRECDRVIAILNYGMTDDAGTCWEIGFAYGLNKPIILYTDNSLQSLMVMNSICETYDIETLNFNEKYIEQK